MSYAKRCVCGAVTIDINGEDISMPFSQFKEEHPGVKLEKDKYSCCNYCVNKWGTDLCSCGSGKKAGKCRCGEKGTSAYNGRKKAVWN